MIVCVKGSKQSQELVMLWVCVKWHCAMPLMTHTDTPTCIIFYSQMSLNENNNSLLFDE